MSKNLPNRAPNEPKSYVDAIVRFIIDRDIVLSIEQEKSKERILYADELIRERKYTRKQIVNMIAVRFDVSTWRADTDISDAHKIFGRARKINKNYVLTEHIDEIQSQIVLARQARQFAILPKLNDNLTYALNSLPPEEKEAQMAPVKIVFRIQDPGAAPLDVDALLAEAAALIKKKSDDYIDFEEQQ